MPGGARGVSGSFLQYLIEDLLKMYYNLDRSYNDNNKY